MVDVPGIDGKPILTAPSGAGNSRSPKIAPAQVSFAVPSPKRQRRELGGQAATRFLLRMGQSFAGQRAGTRSSNRASVPVVTLMSAKNRDKPPADESGPHLSVSPSPSQSRSKEARKPYISKGKPSLRLLIFFNLSRNLRQLPGEPGTDHGERVLHVKNVLTHAQKALDVIHRMTAGWQITDDQPGQRGTAEGHLDAMTATTVRGAAQGQLEDGA